MIIYYDKRTGKILGTQDMKFVDEGHFMHWSNIDDKYIVKKVIGGQGKVIQSKDGTTQLKIKKDNLWDIMREHEDARGKTNLLSYRIKKRGEEKKIIDRKKKTIYID